MKTTALVAILSLAVINSHGQCAHLSTDSLPSHVNNALSPYFPAVFNQDGGSCGSASRIGYMFTHEINAYRHAPANKAENVYPTHFTWLLTNSNSGKEGMAAANGIPRSTVYGGTTYSQLFGNQDCSSTDFGWMQGYDKWYEAMHNRIERNSFAQHGVDTPEGRNYVKRWIWNHWGDTSYAVGGIAGIGVASACKQAPIADDSTGVNRQIGVVGKKYVTRWGDGVDHALTIVGYDDRILFDLDGNGIMGENDKDERGAWIIVNSWGTGWANEGFIYCPYKYGSPVRQGEGGYWKPEFYHVRKDYRPRRTIKLLMDYSRRSELKLRVGIARNLASDTAEVMVDMEHFKYAGDGRWQKEKDRFAGLESATPMLGRWADGRLHSEPMEFGYDLTDLTKGFDTNQPLKYFFAIESKKDAIGHGRLRQASVIDYMHDSLGIETPFAIGRGISINNQGETTQISVIVQPLRSDTLLPQATDNMSADFRLSTPTVKAGERVSFLPVRPMPGLDYEWKFTHADRDTATTLNAAATYPSAGNYSVQLRVTDPVSHKSKRHRLRFTVEDVMPLPDFTISDRVILAGHRVTLNDASRYAPTDWNWLVESRKRSFTSTGRSASFKIDQPGIYDITLTSANAKGKQSKASHHALTVVNTDSRNGLNFSSKAARLTAPVLSTDSIAAFTLEWWMNATKDEITSGITAISTDSIGSPTSWTIHSDAKGTLKLQGDSAQSVSQADFVIAGQWHHYAIQYDHGKVTFLRDAEVVGQHSLKGLSKLKAVKSLEVGGAAHPMRGVIDELRLWHSALPVDTMAQYANRPLHLSEMEGLEKTHALQLYYDFNQSGGDVQDRSSAQRHARRDNFGPDGDAWGLSLGVFSLDLTQPSADLSDSHLPAAHQKPFAATDETVNASSPKRFLAFKADTQGQQWIIENTAIADSVRTGVHVDRNKESALTVTTQWDGFASSLHNHKLYTRLTLPAGRYEFSVNHGAGRHTGNSQLIVAQGKAMPDWPPAEGDTKLLIDSAPLSEGRLCFTLERTTDIALGINFNLQGSTCIPINSFSLIKY